MLLILETIALWYLFSYLFSWFQCKYRYNNSLAQLIYTGWGLKTKYVGSDKLNPHVAIDTTT